MKSNTEDKTINHELEETTMEEEKVLNDYGDDTFVRIIPSENAPDCLTVNIYDQGKQIDSVDIDPESEGIKETVSIYFPYDEDKSNEWFNRQDPDDPDLSDPPPINPDTIPYDISPEIEDIVYENMNEFPLTED